MMLNNFNLVANDFKEIISKYTTADHAKAHLEVSLDFDYREILVSFKIGDIKPYVVSNIYDFLILLELMKEKNMVNILSLRIILII